MVGALEFVLSGVDAAWATPKGATAAAAQASAKTYFFMMVLLAR